MHLFLLGVSHRTAPVDMRERLDFSSRDVGAAVEALAARSSAAESVVLSTCNRSEIYAATADPTRVRGELVAFLSDYHELPRDAFLPHVFTYDDAAAAHHLFRVAAGLDSLVVGEPQILGQVKDAFQVAAERHCTGPLLNKTFHSAFGVGKRVRTETALGEGAVSVSFAAVALARKIFGRLQGRHVLVVGAGEISALTAQHLRTHGVAEIVITSRTAAHAAALAGEVGGRAVPWGDMTTAIVHADIVITATGSQRPIITRADVEAATGRRRPYPLFIIDIAVPRDVDASVGEIEQVFLYNVDDLQNIVQENLARRTAEIARAETIVAEELARFTAWQRSRRAVPTVVALRQRFDEIRRSELQRLDPRLSGLTPEARTRVEEVTRLIVEKLLLEPTEQLKALPDEETQAAYTEAVNRLFRLSQTPDDAAASAAPAAEPFPTDRSRSK
ncbi:MAG: glutamyl-tRNA reductase [Acidobacteria bacterium RIFCSPLOWO2_02_FULL_68_18]|nr:MAG: glutamyl-tRNA reductase [Acidobacteria bacterium RIFCSPLOWO2_02_FULL_68_18]OFW48445.1 MAG: glutamyl-tRNA reductase [Acidobacteria bacterium RIFCSPLOWO2_12_FULL_68_19]